MLAINLERCPQDMDTVEKIRNILQESWMSSVKLDLIPLSESLDDTLKGLDFLLDWRVYPSRMTEFVLILIDRVMDIAQEVEESLYIDMRKTQAILVALQYIILAKNVDEITQGIEHAIAAISRDISDDAETTNNHDDVVLFDDGVDLFDDAPQKPAADNQPAVDIFVPQASLNPLNLAREFTEEHSNENYLALLDEIPDQATRHYNTHIHFLLELSLATNILAGEPLDYDCLYKGIFLHDISLASLPDLIAQKGNLTEDENEKLILHPVRSAKVAHDLNNSNEAELLVLHHHERLDGSGYPFGLKGDNISEQGKLVAIVDTFHYVIEHHAGMGARKRVLAAIMEINIHAGKLYDKHWVKQFNKLLHDYWLPDWRDAQRKKRQRAG